MKRKLFLQLLSAVLLPFCLSCSSADKNNAKEDDITVGIAWRSDVDSEFYTNIEAAFEEVGVTPVLLGQVRNGCVAYEEDGRVSRECVDANDYLTLSAADTLKKNPFADSNVEEVLKGVDAVVFTGGEDISPTLYRQPQPWHGIEAEKDYNATRDVSDYTLMSYCIDRDVNTIGFCRGMQMLGVVSGATVIQDIPTYFADKNQPYNYIHRNEKTGDEYRDYSPHDVTVEKGSLLYTMNSGNGTLRNVPSWHHQSLAGVDGTKLNVTGTTLVNGENMIEAIERTDCHMVMGLQFHPEAAVVKWQTESANASRFMTKAEALRVFKAFVEKVKERKKNGRK